jgi:hypothetical protein
MSLLSSIRFVSEADIKKRAEAAAKAREQELRQRQQQQEQEQQRRAKETSRRHRGSAGPPRPPVDTNWVNPVVERRLQQQQATARPPPPPASDGGAGGSAWATKGPNTSSSGGSGGGAKKDKHAKKDKKHSSSQKGKKTKSKTKKAKKAKREQGSGPSSSSDSSDGGSSDSSGDGARVLAPDARMQWMVSEPGRGQSAAEAAAEQAKRRVLEENAKVDAYEAAEIAAGRMHPDTKVVFGLWRPKQDSRPQRVPVPGESDGQGPQGLHSDDPFAQFGTLDPSRHRHGQHSRASKGSLYSDKDIVSRHSRKLGAAIASVEAETACDEPGSSTSSSSRSRSSQARTGRGSDSDDSQHRARDRDRGGRASHGHGCVARHICSQSRNHPGLAWSVAPSIPHICALAGWCLLVI